VYSILINNLGFNSREAIKIRVRAIFLGHLYNVGSRVGLGFNSRQAIKLRPFFVVARELK